MAHPAVSRTHQRHLGAGPTPGSAYALDGHYNQWVDDVLAGGKMRYEQSFLTISDKPGLEVALAPDKLE